MKKILLITALFLGAIISSNAQIRLGLGVGYATPSGDIADFLKGGVAANAEVGYGVTDHLDLSLMYQGDFLIGDVEGLEVGAVTLSSIMANGRFYLLEKVFKPYVGLGVGFTNVKQGSVTIDGEDITGESESNFAIRPAVGFKVGPLNVSAAYLSAGKLGEASVSDISFNIGTLFSIGI